MIKNLRFRLFLLVLFLIALNARSQQFQRMYGGPNQEISLVAFPSPSGGIYFLGATTSSGSGGADASLMKLDDDGQVVWARTIGNSFLDVGAAMTLAADGGLVSAGSTRSFNGNNPDDIYFFKVDSLGDMVWSKTFSAGELDVATAILKTADDGFAITGFSIIDTVRHVILIRTDANGDTLFTKIYEGAGDEQGVEFFETADGGFVITGKTFPVLPGESDILLMRTDASGNVLWAKSYGETLWDEGAGITRLADGNYLLSGSTISFGQGDFDIMLMKTDSFGNTIWGKTYGGTKSDAGYTARENSDGSIVVSGYSNSLGYGHSLRVSNPVNQVMGDDSTNIFLLKVDAAGDTIWTRTYGDGAQDEAFHFSKMPDGGYLLPGVSTSYTNLTDSTQMLVIRTDSLGHSGCHEQDGHPIIGTTNFITTALNFTPTSGFTETAVTSFSLPWNEAAENACLYIRVNENADKDFSVFPNPASGTIHIKNLNSGIKKIELYTMLGELIYSKNLSDGSIESFIDVSNYLPGIYFLQLCTNTTSVSKKIIIQKN